MLSLTINNSECNISGFSYEQFKELRKLLSYKVDSQSSYFSGNWRNTRYLIDKKGNFPTGLLYLVDGYLSNKPFIKVKDRRVLPEATNKFFKPSFDNSPYDEQAQAVMKAITSHHGSIKMPTGSGKSFTMALLINALQVKTLIVVPNLTLKNQLKKDFLNWFGQTHNIVIENIDSSNLKNLKDFDCLILDEAHHSAAKTYRKLNKTAWNSIYYRFFFTATPYRSRDEEQLLMESITGKVIYSLSYQTAVNKGLIVPIEAFYYEIPKTEIDSNSWAEVYSKLIVNNTKRNKLIADILSNLYSSRISTLCLVKEVKHGINILDCLNPGSVPFEYMKGENEDNESLLSDFNSKAINSLIATNGVCGEGVDTKPAEFVIIGGLGKSRNQFIQQVGRVVRKYPGKDSGKVIIFLDKSHKWTLNHFRAQVKFLKEEYGIKPIKLNID